MLGATPERQDQIDPAEAMMREVGAQLRQVRLERDEDLDQVAEFLRIKSTYLFGIEQGDMSVMPGRTYALGFLRSYADYLGFDGDDLINQIKSTVDELTDKTRLRVRTPMPESRLPRTPLVVLSLAVVAGVYAGWSYLNRDRQGAADTVVEVPASLRDMALDALSEADREADRSDEGDAQPADVPDEAAPTEGAGVEDSAAIDGEPADAGPAELGAAQPAQPADVLVREGPALDAEGADVATTTRPPVVAGATDAADAIGTGARLERDDDGGATARVPVLPDPGIDQSLVPEAGPPLAVGTPAPAPVSTTLTPPAGPSRLEELAALNSGAPVTAVGAGASGESDDPDPAGETDALLQARDRAAAADAPIYEVENADARVIVQAREPSWIRISSTSGDYLRTRTLQPGEQFLVPNRADLSLWTGNAGGLEIIVDGEVLPPLGTEGAVLRDVSLDPLRLLAQSSQLPIE